jgi:outer membrane biosynthesis protein TonB
LSSASIEWRDEHSLDHRRRLRNSMLVSVAFHGMIFAAFAVSPSRTPVPMPTVLSVELVSGPPAAPRPNASKPAPTRAAPKPPSAEPAPPEPPAPAPPPIAKAPVQVLPEEAPSRIREVPPEVPAPKVVAKPEPMPKPKPNPKPKPELSYEDAMAALDDELGVDETASLLTPAEAPGASEPETSSGEAQPSENARIGVVVSPELAAWILETRRRIQSKWVMPPNFRGRGLATTLELRLTVTGDLAGTPRVVVSSGDPYFDDNAVRAMMTAAPLPSPPKPGLTVFVFRSEGL